MIQRELSNGFGETPVASDPCPSTVVYEKSVSPDGIKLDRSPVTVRNLIANAKPVIDFATGEIANGNYGPAEERLTTLLIGCGDAKFDERHVIIEKLINLYFRQCQWGEVETMVQKLLLDENYDLTWKDNDLLRVLQGLSENFFCHEEFSKAEYWCQIAVDYARKRFGAPSMIYNTSVCLLIEILERQGRQDDAEIHKLVLKGKTIFDYVHDGNEGAVEGLVGTALLTERNAALILAAQKEREPVISLLLEKRDGIEDVDVETREINGQSALMEAARRGFNGVIELLLENGADIEAKDKFGYTSMMLADQNGRNDTVELLLSKGAKRNPFMWRARASNLNKLGEKPNIVRPLKKKKWKSIKSKWWRR